MCGMAMVSVTSCFHIHGCNLVKFICLALLDRNRALGTLAKASSKAVTKIVANQSGLAVDNLDSPFRARRHTDATPVTKVFINPDYLPYGHWNTSLNQPLTG